MSQPEMQMADVQIILRAEWQDRHAEALAILKAAGLEVEEVNEADGEIEGVVPASRIAELKRLDFVAYIRTVFRYGDEENDGDSDEDGGFQQL